MQTRAGTDRKLPNFLSAHTDPSTWRDEDVPARKPWLLMSSVKRSHKIKFNLLRLDRYKSCQVKCLLPELWVITYILLAVRTNFRLQLLLIITLVHDTSLVISDWFCSAPCEYTVKNVLLRYVSETDEVSRAKNHDFYYFYNDLR